MCASAQTAQAAVSLACCGRGSLMEECLGEDNSTVLQRPPLYGEQVSVTAVRFHRFGSEGVAVWSRGAVDEGYEDVRLSGCLSV